MKTRIISNTHDLKFKSKYFWAPYRDYRQTSIPPEIFKKPLKSPYVFDVFRGNRI